jgi:hypothetical protein
MTLDEAAYLSKYTATTPLKELTAGMIGTARQNLVAAHSTLPNDAGARWHEGFAEHSVHNQSSNDHGSSWSLDE